MWLIMRGVDADSPSDIERFDEILAGKQRGRRIPESHGGANARERVGKLRPRCSGGAEQLSELPQSPGQSFRVLGHRVPGQLLGDGARQRPIAGFDRAPEPCDRGLRIRAGWD
jgi:hypothetical protein